MAVCLKALGTTMISTGILRTYETFIAFIGMLMLSTCKAYKFCAYFILLYGLNP